MSHPANDRIADSIRDRTTHDNSAALEAWREEYPDATWTQILAGKGEWNFARENRREKMLVCVDCGMPARLKDMEIARYDVSSLRCYQCYRNHI